MALLQRTVSTLSSNLDNLVQWNVPNNSVPYQNRNQIETLPDELPNACGQCWSLVSDLFTNLNSNNNNNIIGNAVLTGTLRYGYSYRYSAEVLPLVETVHRLTYSGR